VPELPEVETMRRGAAAAVGSRIAGVSLCRCRRKPIAIAPAIASFRRRVLGRRIVGTDRIGKRVLVCLEGGEAIVFEPRMTGLVLLAEPPTPEHLRIRFALAGGRVGELMYWDRRGLGSVRLYSTDELAEHFGNGRLGPDALKISLAQLRARLAGSGRAIKVALLDQRAVAGIGNLYAAEILHVAGVHPAVACRRLRAADWEAIHAAIRRVLREAIRYEGSTLGDGTYRNALNGRGRYQNHHRVYARQGARCPTCGRGTVRRIVQAQRATFYCPVCQRQRGH